MRVLWFSGNTSLFDANVLTHRGGWIGSLESILSGHSEIELGVSFLFSGNAFKETRGKTTYYPMKMHDSWYKRMRWRVYPEEKDRDVIELMKTVIDDFRPDIIHIWGIEMSFGLIAMHTNVPVVIHVQGLLNPCFNAFFIPGISKFDYIIRNTSKNIKTPGLYDYMFNKTILKFWKHYVGREKLMYQKCKYFMGRTSWDKDYVKLMAPDSSYFYCNELLRPSFYNNSAWQPHDRKKLIIVSVISGAVYKGHDVILKCANILKNHTNTDFIWNIYGITKFSGLAERVSGIKATNVNLIAKGILFEEELIQELKSADVYVHPSYIDNSPNSLCEAQILGLPVIATYVGGVPSLIENNTSGILVAANDPWAMATKILELYENKQLGHSLGKRGRELALRRHDPDAILNTLVSIYTDIAKRESLKMRFPDKLSDNGSI